MTNLFTEMNKEVAEHFQDKSKKQEQPKDEWAGFKSYSVGGMQVIDLTSVDVDWSAYESKDLASDERKGIYGDQAGNPNRM